MIDAVNRSQRLDEIDSVTFVAPELCPDSMSVDRDADRDRIYRIFKMNIQSRQSCQILYILSLLVLAGSGSLSIDALSARVALTDACSLTAQSAKVVKLRSPDPSAFYEVNVVDVRAAEDYAASRVAVCVLAAGRWRIRSRDVA